VKLALHTVAETAQYLGDAANVGLTDEERKAIVDLIANDPRQGVELRGSGGVRKNRVAGRGKGKSGGTALSPPISGKTRLPICWQY
jgi:hypothetical protein